MTSTAFVQYRENGFWAYDVAGSVFLWFLIQSAEEHLATTTSPWLQEMIQNWRVAAVVTEMAHYADDEWTPAQVELIVQLCRTTTGAIRQHVEFSGDDVQAWPVLDDQRIFVRGHDPIPAEPVARLGDAFASLLQGQLDDPPEQHLWFYTLDMDASTIKMNAK
jgi:hypothetical protein